MRIGGDPRASDIMTEVGDGLRGVGPGRILPYLSQMGRDLALGQGVTDAVGVESRGDHSPCLWRDYVPANRGFKF